VGVESARREMDVRVVRCDHFAPAASGVGGAQCGATTAEFLPDVAEAAGGPVLLNATWLQLRTGGIRQWYFCSHRHLLEWIAGPGADVLGTGVQPLGTLKTRRET
jgi:hypothetical protein